MFDYFDKVQKQASNPNSSVWVDASAGTGKTKVLTDRVLRLLIQGNKLHQILCLTFTKAAAYEMRTRIHDQLLSWVTCSESNLVDNLTALQDSVPTSTAIDIARKLFFQVIEDSYGLQITTIHGFCQKILNSFALSKASIQNLVLMSNNEQSILLNKTLSESLFGEEIKQLMQEGKTFNGIIAHIQELLGDINSIQNLLKLDEKNLLNNLQSFFGVSLHDSKEAIYEMYCLNVNKLQQVSQIFAKGSNTLQKKGVIIANIVKKKKLDSSNFQDYKNIFFTTNGEVRKNLVSITILTKYIWLKDFLQLEIANVNAVESKINSFTSLKNAYYLVLLSRKVLLNYEKNKLQASVIDFNDLLFRTLNILKNNSIDSVLYKFSEGIQHILLDETQDTSSLQWQIVLQLVNGIIDPSNNLKNSTVFIVGDGKQSIYSFQGADSDLFSKVKKSISQKLNNLYKPFINVEFNTSFRSCQAVLDIVNNVFSKLFNQSYVKHCSFRPLDRGEVECWPLIPYVKKTADVENIANNSTQILAKKIACYIAEQLNDKTVIGAKSRLIQANDFMILLQRRSVLMYQVISALKKKNIPVAGADRFILNEHIIVQDLIALGDFLLLDNNDYALACVLKSPLFNFSELELLNLCIQKDRSSSLWQELKMAKLEIADILQNMQKQAHHLDVFAFFHNILLNQGYQKKFIIRMGAEAIEIIAEFLKYCFDYSQNNLGNLQHFIANLKQSNIVINKDLTAEKSQGVRIMTVHGAKGLQAPIVILPDTTYVPQKIPSILWHTTKLNKIIPIAPAADKKSSPPIIELKNNYLDKQYMEYLRLLYVAMTRAENKLIVAGYENAKNSSKSNWYNLVAQTMHDIGKKYQDIYRYEVRQSQNLSVSKLLNNKSNISDISLPKCFLSENRLTLTKTSAKFTAPSHLNDNYYSSPNHPDPKKIDTVSSEIGLFVHKLLEELPKYDSKQWEAIINNQRLKYPHINQANLDEFGQLILTILNDNQLQEIFYAPDSYPEVAVAGYINNELFRGQIDRLIISSNKLRIIDFKTSHKSGQTPLHYIKQLDVYKQLLAKVYPKKQIESYILWLRSKYLEKIS